MRKAQASMEYVSTYIYAGLALVVVVGAMGYFGAFDSTTYTKESCESGEQLSCADAQITADGTMGVMLKNNLDRDILITNYTIRYEDQAFTEPNANIVIERNRNGTIDFGTTGVNFNEGKKESFDYTVTYQPIGSTRTFTLTGTATTRVEEEINPICGNYHLEAKSEECDRGPDGGWIPEQTFSCKNYYLDKMGYDESILATHVITGSVWCTGPNNDNEEGCERRDINPEQPDLGCKMQTCSGCINSNGECRNIGTWDFPTNDKRADGEVDLCVSPTTWNDCQEGGATNMCPVGMHCELNSCVADTEPGGTCASCIADDGSCGCVAEDGSCVPENEWYWPTMAKYGTLDEDLCLGEDQWSDCDGTNTEECPAGARCDAGICMACDGCIDMDGDCIAVGSTGYTSQHPDIELDYCASAGFWRDCDASMPDTCPGGNTCDQYGYCHTTQTSVSVHRKIADTTLFEGSTSIFTSTYDETMCSTALACVWQATCYGEGQPLLDSADIDGDGDFDYCNITTQEWYDCKPGSTGMYCGLYHLCSAQGDCTCTPKTCTQLGRECGTWDDGCGGTVTCGPCPAGACTSQGACEIEQDDITGAYSGDEPTDGDSDPINLINGATYTDDGISGQAFEFDGTDSYAYVGDWSIPGDHMTITAWINVNNIPSDKDPRIISKGGTYDVIYQNWALLIERSGSPEFRLGRPGGSTSSQMTRLLATSVAVATNEWHHIAGVFDRPYMRIYYDGVQVASAYHNYALSESTDPIWIGAQAPNPADRPFNGTIDELYVFNRSLSATEIAQLATPPQY